MTDFFEERPLEETELLQQKLPTYSKLVAEALSELKNALMEMDKLQETDEPSLDMITVLNAGLERASILFASCIFLKECIVGDPSEKIRKSAMQELIFAIDGLWEQTRQNDGK